ncbi:MAG: PASTA domain-containing protein [Bacteroidia bacterium]|nr:PASTA domain-containing protein [Bacteroidia bacterium]
MFGYFKTKEFIISLLSVLILGGLGYVFFFNVFLPSYTSHGESVVVPDISKMPLDEARKKLKEADLLMAVKDSLYLPNITPMTVLKQEPAPSSTVKPDRTVFLTISKAVPPMVKMPKVVDLSIYQAKAKLESWKLQVKEIRKVPDIARNVVLRALLEGKDIKEGTDIPQGTGITLIIGEGEKIQSFARVPSVIGMQYNEAASKLSMAGLSIDPQWDPADGDGKAYKQVPEKDSVRRGQGVTVWFHSKGPSN